MPHMKVAVLGAGSFVFGPSVLKDAIAVHRLDGLDLALVDPNHEAVELMAAVGRRMSRELGVDLNISSHTTPDAALAGADFVICAAAHELHRRFEMDREIITRLSPQHLITEFGGIAGISYSLRQIAMIEKVCADMKRLCPNAWLLVTANPLPRIAQAAHERGIRTAGFCSVSLLAYRSIWQILHGEQLGYPFEPARSQIEVVSGGVNHFSWVLQAQDAADGTDLYPTLREKAAQLAETDQPLTTALLSETGYLPAPGDDHIRDFLAPTEDVPQTYCPVHGSTRARQHRLDLLHKVAAGLAPFEQLFDCESWEKPMDLVAAMTHGRTASFRALNLINCGQVASLPGNVFVETPAVGTSVGPMPQKVDLPLPVTGLCRRTATLTDTIVRAANHRSLRLLHEAVDLDPTIIRKRLGKLAVEECIRAHSDILPTYA